jgi:polyvinyl alcohol dehydrogenase (cytochrome)
VIRAGFVRLALSTAFASLCASASAAELSGEALYATKCASCHDQTGARIPSRAALMNLSSARILRTLDFGAMMSKPLHASLDRERKIHHRRRAPFAKRVWQ